MNFLTAREVRTANITFAIGGFCVPVQAGADIFVVNHPPAGGLRINPDSYRDGENRQLRQARKR